MASRTGSFTCCGLHHSATFHDGIALCPGCGKVHLDPRGRRQESKARSGWQSSKLHLALIGMAVLTAVFIASVLITGKADGFGEYVLGLCTLVASAHASRVAESFALRPRGADASIQPEGDRGEGETSGSR